MKAKENNNTLSQDDVLFDAIHAFGEVNQMDIAVEEMAELIQAISKIKRTFTEIDISLLKNKDVKFKDTKEALIYANVCSEIADVKIMIRQLEIIFDKEQIAISEERKIDRLKERIDRMNKKDREELIELRKQLRTY